MLKEEYRKILDRLKFLNKIQEGIKIQTFKKYPCPWIEVTDPGILNYIETYGFPNHREILINEILIDVDSETVSEGIKHGNIIEQRLKDLNITYKRFYSGGSGQHFHILFKKKDISILNKYHSLGDIRRELIKFYCGKENLHPDKWEKNPIKSHICLYNKKLVQIESTLHRKGKYKKFIFGTFGLNNIPEKVIIKLSALEQLKKARAERIKQYVKNNEILKMECISFLEGKTVNRKNIFNIQDGLYRAMFALISYYKRLNYSNEDITKKINIWKSKVKKNRTESRMFTIADNKVRYTVNNCNGSAGCNFIMNLLEDIEAITVCKNCKYNLI